MKHHATDHLHVVVTHSQKSFSAFSADSKGFNDNVVRCLAITNPLLEFFRLHAQLVIGHRFVSRLKRIDRIDSRLQPFDVTGVGRTKQTSDSAFEAGDKPTHKVSCRIPNSFQLFHGFVSTFSSSAAKRMIWATGWLLTIYLF